VSKKANAEITATLEILIISSLVGEKIAPNNFGFNRAGYFLRCDKTTFFLFWHGFSPVAINYSHKSGIRKFATASPNLLPRTFVWARAGEGG
jgi:hypothetical protein